MSRVSVLFDLQQTDSTIDSHNVTISSIDRNLSDTSAIEAARQAVSEAEGAFVTARSSLKELEATAQKQEQHANELEEKLYAGKIKGQKEMAAAQSEIETFRQRKKETDDQTVEAMVNLETADANFKAAKAKLAATEAEWEKATTAYRDERARHEAALLPLRADREKRLKVIMPTDIPIYEKLRSQKQGIAVAEVINGKICSRCRVEQPLARVRDVKSGMILVTCHSCGRILYYKL